MSVLKRQLETRRARVIRPLIVFILALSSPGCLKQAGAKGAAGKPREEHLNTATSHEILKVEETARPNAYFELEGEPFCFLGTNNYYLNFKSRKMVDAVFDHMVAMGLRVMRFWGFIDRGSLDSSVPSVDGDGTKDGVFFQYWDAERQAPAYHDGPDGLERLDYVLHKAREKGVKLTFVFTNNWREFGGMDQYLTWYGLDEHHLFYTDERVKKAYKDWVHQVISRVNTIDGVPYREDPAIFAWELANEPRTKNFSEFDAPDGWDMTTITRWADEMSAYVKSIAPNHLVAVGDEGFLNDGSDHWAYKGTDGVDHRALSALSNVDFATFHLYPDNWGTGYEFGYDWIRAHLEVAYELGKPTVLEEYGIIVKRDEQGKINWGWERRKTAYTNWNDLFLKGGGNGSMFWILVGYDDHHGLYPDYDHYSVYNPGPTAELLQYFAKEYAFNAPACKLARAAEPAGEPSKFVRVRPAPGKAEPEAALSHDDAPPG